MRKTFYYSLLVIALGLFSCQETPKDVKEKKPRVFPEYS